MIVIHCCQYSAPYKGAFINSLERLDFLNTNTIKFVYIFPEKTRKTDWIGEFMQNHDVFFTCDDVQKCSSELLLVFNKVKPNIIHTHFDGYDMPVVFAKRRYIKNTEKDIKLIWHLRNTIQYHSNFLKRLYQFFVFNYHYGYLAKNVNIISVSKEMAVFINQFGKRNVASVSTDIIANGVVFHENTSFKFHDDSIVFGAFGGRNVQKRIDLLLEAATILISKGLNLRVVITKGVDTEIVVNNFFEEKKPDWLSLIDQTNDIGFFFDSINCFVSTSAHETFSNAILEATFYNIPVIQTDISGTIWNADRPSTFLFESLNSKHLSEKMEEVISIEQQKLSDLCLKTREINGAQYNIDIWVGKINNVYNKVVTK